MINKLLSFFKLDKTMIYYDKIYKDLVYDLYKKSFLAIYATLVSSGVILYFFYNFTDKKYLLTWFFIQLSLSSIRFLIYSRIIKRIKESFLKKIRHYETYFGITTLLSGILWGSLVFLNFNDRGENDHYFSFLAFVLGGLAAGASMSMASSFKSFLGYIFTSLTPVAVTMFMDPDQVSHGMSFFMTIYILALIVINRMNNQHIIESLSNKFKNAELVERFNEGQRIAKFGTWDLDIKNKKLQWSNEVYNIFRKEPNDFTPSYESFLDLVHPEDRDRVSAAYSNSLLMKEPYEVTFRALLKDGSIKNLWESGINRFDEYGKPVYSIGVVHDVTDKNIIESETKKMSTALEQSPLSIMITDAYGNIEYINRTFTLVSGFEKDDIIGKKLEELPFLDSSDPNYQNIVEAVLNKRYWNGEVQVRAKEDYMYWESVSIAPVYNDAREIINYIIIKEDITPRKAMEISLINSRQEAEDANKAKSDFLASMSHELRTPLNAILGFEQLLEENLENKEQQEFLYYIKKSGSHLLTLINEILDLARIESGKTEVCIEDINLETILDEINILMAPMASRHHIRLEKKSPENKQLYIQADYTRIKQVLLNLVSNAIKYNNEGGFVIFEAAPVEDKRIKISVTDNGSGISFDKQSELFKPFSRLGKEKSEIEGTGIGLVVTKNLVELMQGEIGFESAPGKGSTFWIEFPFKDIRKVTESEELTKAKDLSNLLSESSKSFSILYIDDNPVNLKLMENIFSKVKNTALITAQSGQEGFESAGSKDIDLIIMDIRLSGINGYELLSQLKKSPGAKNIPAIAISALATKKDIENGLNAGFAKYITKPFEVADFLNTIKVILLDKPKETNVPKDIKILIVEDNIINQTVLKKMLEKEGISCETADDGKSAMKKFESGNDYDIVLMDLYLPDTDGIELTRNFRKMETEKKSPSIPIVAVTGENDPIVESKFKKAGCNEVIVKPIDKEKILKILQIHTNVK